MRKLIEDTEKAIQKLQSNPEAFGTLAEPVKRILEHDLELFKDMMDMEAPYAVKQAAINTVLDATERAGDYNIIRAINGVQDA